MSDRLHVFTRKGLFTFTSTGSKPSGWGISSTAFLGDPVTALLEDPRDGTLYAALRLGHFGAKLQRSTDGGESWEEIARPAFPRQQEPASDQGGGADDPEAARVDQIWCLEAGGHDEPAAIWAGTIPGGLFRSGHGGSSWELERGLWDRQEREQWFGGGYDDPGIHSILVHPSDHARLLVGVSVGGVWTSGDGGRSWSCTGKGLRAEYMPPERSGDPIIQDPHRIVSCAAAPDQLWIQHHNGIFRSTDWGGTWREITAASPSRFGFAVAVHPERPDTAWFVPAVKDQCRVPVDGKLCVTRTRDGGESFEILTDGLPQSHAYDVVYRHALDIDGSGERLAMGSTTGSLWITHDQGDCWTCLSSNMPPIYGVRFAP